MNDGQSYRIAVAFARETARSPTARLCAACVEVLEVAGAGITVLSGAQPVPVCVSDSDVAGLEILQFSSRQGPCQDAYASGVSVHASRLDGPPATRWPTFVDLARKSGIRAVSAYPLMNETSKVGVLTLYRSTEGDLSRPQQEDSATVARVLLDTLTSMPPADLSTLQAAEAFAYRAEIYQASGMIAVQLGVSPDVALVRIRAHAAASNMSVLDVATEIVALRLRLPVAGTDAQP